MKINREQGHVALNDPPAFEYGEKVKSRKTIRDDGTFVQQFYIYGIEFIEHGYRVGMKGRELDYIDDEHQDMARAA